MKNSDTSWDLVPPNLEVLKICPIKLTRNIRGSVKPLYLVPFRVSRIFFNSLSLFLFCSCSSVPFTFGVAMSWLSRLVTGPRTADKSPLFVGFAVDKLALEICCQYFGISSSASIHQCCYEGSSKSFRTFFNSIY